jgi:hypothetical protein
MFSHVLAALGLTTCVALAVHMALPLARQRRVNALLTRWAWQVRGRSMAAFGRARGWRQERLRERAATDEANELIRRASQRSKGAPPEGEWDGNVYRPKAFDKPDRKKLH